MNDGDNKRKLYDALSKDYDMGTFEQFSTDVEDEGKRKKLYEAIKGEYDLPDFDGFTRQLVGERSQVQQPSATPAQQEEHSPYQMAQGNTPTYNYGGQMPSAPRPATPRSKGNTQPTQTAEAQPLGPEKFAKQMQFEQRMRQRVPSPEAMMQDFSQRMENIRKGNQPFGSASEQRYNPETGKMETVYFTKSGEEVSTPMEQQRINREVSDPVGSELREAYAERDRLNKEIDRRTREVDKANEPSFAQMLAASEGGGYNPVFAARSEDPELSMLWTAKRKNEARIKALEREGKNEGFFRTLGKTLFSLDTWDFGLFDLIDAGNMMAYGDKKLKGSLGEAQESMMENTYRANVAQQQYGENDTFWQRAGEITGNAIPFVAEFALTGGYSGLTQAGTKAGSKMAAKYATGKVGQWVIKNTGTLVGDMAAGFAMANTTGGMNTAADIINRHQGQLVKDEDGDYVFDGGKSWGRSIYEGEMANTLEYYTEKLGVHLDGAGKVVGGWLGKGMERMGAGRVSELFNRITGSEWAKITGQVLRKGGVQDYPSEVVEEEANILLNSLLVGDNKFSDFVDGKTQADIWGGMMLSIGFMQSPGMVGGGYQTAQYYRYKHKTDMSDRVASTRLTPERWEPWRERIDNTTNEDMRDVISDIIGSQELQDEEKKAAINYVGNLMQMRGYNLRTTADAKDKINGTEAVDEAVDADNESYQNGYEADEQSRRDIAIEYSMNPDDDVRAAAVEGVRQRIEDDADMEVEGWREEGRKMMHSDGSIRPAVLKVKNENGEDTEVYIVEGNVQMMADGTMVDPETSDRSVVIYDPATGERKMIDPTSDMGILSIGEATSAEDFEYEIQRRRDEYVQRMLDEAQCTVRVDLGQPLTMPDGREGTVMAISPDGESFTVVANDGSGEEVRMERSDLQQIADAAALADYQARHQEDEATAEQPTEEETDEPTAVAPGTVEGAPTEFLPDMDITILDDAGNEQPATVMGIVRYERGKFVPDETGNIVEYVVDGQVKHENTAKLAEKVVSHVDANLAAQETPAEQPAAVEQPTVETPTAEVETPASEPVVEATGTVAEQPTVEPMPMREDGEADFLATTPERGHQFIYNEAGLSREEAGQFVKANLEMATKALDKAKKDAPKMGTSLVKYKQQQAEHQAKVDAAQQAVDYWQGVKATQSAIVSAEMAEQAERDRVAHEAAVLAEQQRQAEEIAKQEEQAALGSNAVAPQIVEKWQSAPKLEGAANEITLADGSKVKGHYVIVESGAATPSHNPNMGFVRNDGFPIDENGQTVNDRDYERDQDAQQITRQMADSYDSRAIQNVPVVSPDGVVLSGNGRTMAGELAAQQGTDGEYIDHLKKYPQQFGFEPQQFEGMAHPRLLFVADEAMPYTTETFAKFNQQDMKSQSRTEQSVKMGKTVDDNTFGRIIRSINSFDSLADFYNDPVAASNAIGELHGAGAINNMQLADMMDGEKVSGNGRQTLENMLIGKAFESNPDAIRQLAEFPAMRQSVVSALAEIANNIRLGEDYSLESELAQAINLAYQARKNGVKAGDKVSWFARQQSLFPFDTGETVADFTNATVLMLADCINDSRVSQLKKVLGVYNQKAESSAAGQYNIFSGVINSKSDILKEVTDLFDYGTAQEQQSALDNAVEQRKQAAAVQQPGGEESVPEGSTVEGSDAGSVAEEVTEPQATEDHGQTERTETDRRDIGEGLRDEVPSGAEGAPRGDSGVDIGSLAEGLAAEQRGDTGRSARAEQEAVGHQIIENAKKSGVFIDRSTLNSFGERVRKPSGESVVYVDEANNRVVKVKNPYAKDNLKGHAASDALYEHIVHNLLFPNTQYRLIGISDDSVGDVRFVLEQDILRQDTPATQQDIDRYLINELGLKKVERPYLHYENDYYSITDVEASGDNVFVDDEGSICFIDPIIKFKRPAVEVINYLTTGNAIAAAEAEVDTNPTEGQKEAGNYKKGHLKLDGYDITIEQPKGSIRRGTDDNGKQWEQEMHNTYGYIRGTEGVDGDHIDVFLSDDPTSGDVFVVDQVDQMGIFDEHKVMYGFPDIESAKAAYLSNYEEGWQGCGAITPVSKEEFKKWIESSHRKTKPFAEYASVKTNGDTQLGEGSPYARYHREAEAEIQQLLDAAPDRTGPVASPERTEAIQKIADMLNEADSAIEDLELNDDQLQRFQARRDAAEKWLEENVYGEGVALSVEDLKEASDEAAAVQQTEQPADAEASDTVAEEVVEQPMEEVKKSKWVDDEDAERFEALRRRMRELNGHLNMGVNPEQLAIGVEMSYYVIKHGAHKFADYAKQMIDALGEWVRPYLKSFYNGARDLPEMEAIDNELTPFDEVRSFDVMNFDKEGPKDIIAMADEVVREREADRQAEEATAKLKQQRNERRKKAIEKASAELEKLTQAEDETLHREGDGNQTVEIPYKESLAKSKAAGYTKKQHDAMVARRWKQRIEQSKGYAERLNLGDRVTVVLSADELEAQGMTLSEEQKKDKGWYNKRTGQIFVILENNTSMDDVLKTILHEGVGHHGLRELFGKHFSQFLWNVYENADESIRGEIVELSKAHGWNTETAIEEYLARLAEDENFERPELQSWWQKVKHWFLEMLHKIGFEDFNPEWVITDNELRYILWRSYENLVEPDRYRSIVEDAKDIAKQWNLGVGRYEEKGEARADRWGDESPMAAEPGEEILRVSEKSGNFAPQKELTDEEKAVAYENFFQRQANGEFANGNGHAYSANFLHFFKDGKIVNSIQIEGNEDKIDKIINEYGTDRITENADSLDEGARSGARPGSGVDNVPGGQREGDGGVEGVHRAERPDGARDNNEVGGDLQRVPYGESGINDDEDILHRDGEDIPKAHARESYERMMSRGINQFTEAVQDSMLGLKSLYKAILDAEGNAGHIDDVRGYENAYLAENRMNSANEAQTFAWQKEYMDPLTNEVYKLTRGKKKLGKGFRKDLYNELVDYMMAKHGLERNAVFAERDAKKASEGGADYNAELQQNLSRDYAGLTALTGKQDVAEAEAEARRIVEAYEEKHDTTDLWEKVNAATKSSLYTLAASGLMTPERHQQVRDMFKYYIPLQGFDEKVSENVYAYMGSDGTLGYGTPIRSAKGRKSRADDPLATIRMNGEAAIRQANRNAMKKHFLRFVMAHPSDLVSVSDVWLRKNDVTGEWEQYFDADLKETDSPSEVEQKMYEFEKKMENLSNEHPDQYRRSKDLPNVPFRVVQGKDMRQHQVLVQSGGKNYVLTINGNPRAAQALNGMTNPDVNTENLVGKALNIAQAATRMRSLLVTSLSPAFVLSNYLRDMGYSNLMVWVKENPKYALEFNKQFFALGFPSATKLARKDFENMGSLYVKWKNGKLQEKVLNGTANERERLFYEFKMNGGETGWTSWHSIEYHKKDLEKALRRGGDINKNFWKTLKGWLDLFNQVVENNARFAAYVASRKTGRSVERSVWDAKEISVNFNKKGSGDKFLTAQGQKPIGIAGSIISGYGRGFLMFFNASVQGTFGNFAKNIVRNPAKGIGLVSFMALLGYFAPLISEVLCNAFGGDGDDDDKNAYYNLPEYVRRTNLCFRFSRNMPWIKIPLAIEFRAAYGFGELTQGIINGGERYTKQEAAEQYASQLSQLLPVDFLEGRGGLHAFVPSIYQPWKEAKDNVKWTGLPIYREKPDYRGKGDPRRFYPQWRYRPFNNADKTIVYATKWLNDATGGSDVSQGWIDWNPSKIEYLLNQYLGGPGQAFGRVKKTAETVFGDRDFEWRNVPFLNRVLYEGDESTEARKLNNEYYSLLDEYFETGALLKGFESMAESDDKNEADKYKEKLEELKESRAYKHYEIFDQYNQICYNYYKLERDAEGEEKKTYERIQMDLYRHLINIIHASDDGDEAAERRYTEEMESYIKGL